MPPSPSTPPPGRAVLQLLASRLAAVARSAKALTVCHVVPLAASLNRNDVIRMVARVNVSALAAPPRTCRQHSLTPSSVPLVAISSLRRCRSRLVVLRLPGLHLAFPARLERPYLLRHPAVPPASCSRVQPGRPQQPAVARGRLPPRLRRTMSGLLQSTACHRLREWSSTW